MPSGDETQPLLAPRKASKHVTRHKIAIAIAVAAAAVVAASACIRRILPANGATRAVPSISGATRISRYRCPKHLPKVQSLPGFASYLSVSNPSHPRTIGVNYDARSLRINDEATILLSGSMHPVRATRSTWNRVLDHAVTANLNMITIYLMWSYHQPVATEEIDWTLPGGDWDVASALWEAACRGLFVHIRVGPYVCAEYDYGGIPSWVPLVHGGEADGDKMNLRRPNQPWMEAMEVWVDASLQYLTNNNLFGYQGGPIILAQIENELGGEVDPETENILPNQTLQDYADFCGKLANEKQSNVIWTMCNGLSSNSTINTCNGYGEGGACSTTWLEEHGQSGRIQIDQPALWTENELGFQIWGDSPSNTSDYFWGRTAREVAADCLRWFARGGTHLNTYMFWGGYNRGRMSGASIMNAYASDGIICPHTEPRQPKFDHIRQMHRAIASIADVLVTSPTALGKELRLQYRNATSEVWITGTKQVGFQYSRVDSTIIFVENNSPFEVDVRLPVNQKSSGGDTERHAIIRMLGWSAAVYASGKLLYNSTHIQESSMAYRRITREVFQLENWTLWNEQIGARQGPSAISDGRPWELTRALIISNTSTDYIWYTTSFDWDGTLIGEVNLEIETQKATAISAFLDEIYLGNVYNHEHRDGNCTLSIPFPGHLLTSGAGKSRKIHILIESLGFNNLIGRWGSNSAAKTKGITGNVWIKGSCQESHKSITRCLSCGKQAWLTQVGLNNEQGNGADNLVRRGDLMPHPCTWSLATFLAPSSHEHSLQVDEELLLRIVTGRGEVWLNGESLGRFWNITRRSPAAPGQLSQEYYHVPRDLLKFGNGEINRLLFFNAVGGDMSKGARLVKTRLVHSHNNKFRDEVDFFGACI